ncbi:ionotropic receptor 25a isoform X1 [Leptidea sinapis]|uniref:ionotropic receptor 25a isoform X1 n=2 Tax=Leptidea sinapis TaxID=189913 RepID=UPI002143F9D1|nr:ionotropic receptor 25a isoform X1 [Leptidea sinapis]
MMHFIIIIVLLIHKSFSQTTQNINVLFVNEENNALAEKSFEIAKEYIRRNPNLGLAVDPVIVVGNRTDAKAFLENVCRKYNEMISMKKSPHIVLDFTVTGVGSETIKSFTSALALPTISGSFGQDGDLRQWRGLNVNQTQYLLQVMPPADILPEAIRAIVTKQDITNAAIIFDEFFVMDHKYKSLLQNIPTRHVITPVKSYSKDEIKTQLRSLRELDIVNFFVVGSLKTIKNVLDAANENQYFGRKTAWFAMTLDKGDIGCGCRDATIVFMKPTPDAKSRDRLGKIKTTYSMNGEPEITSAFYFDLSLRSFLAIKSLLDSGKWPNDMKYISCDDYDGQNSPNRTLDLKTAFEDIKETATYAPFYIPEDGSMNGKSFMEFTTDLTAVTIKDGASIGSKSLGSWKAGLSNPLLLNDPENMTDYTAQLVYRIVTVEQKPFVIKDDDAPKGFKGYCIDLIEEIRQIVKFDYEITLAPDGNYGTMDDNGNWNGIIKELVEKRADIGLASLSVMAERENVVDFTVPYYDLVGITILMKQPRTPTSLFKFLTVLENDVWFSILAAYFFTSFLMWVFDKWSPYSYQNNREKYLDDEEKREFTLKECLWFCMTSLTPQGGGEAPKNLSGRLLAATWWLFGFIIIASYTANLAAFLTVSRLDTPIESLDDLSKQYKIQYAPLNGSGSMTYFERMANIEVKFYEIWKDMSLNDSLSDVERAKLAVWDYPVSDKYTKMWQAMQEAGLPNSVEEAVERVRSSKSSSEGFAWLGDATDIRYHVLTSCDLQMVGDEFSRKPYAIAVQQGSPLKDQFNNAILQLLNKRKLEKLKETWWNNNPEAMRCEKQDDQSDGISIQNIGGVFIVIFMGIGLACVTLGVEYWWYKWRRRPTIGDVSQVLPAKTLRNNTEYRGDKKGEEQLSQRAKNLVLSDFKRKF